MPSEQVRELSIELDNLLYNSGTSGGGYRELEQSGWQLINNTITNYMLGTRKYSDRGQSEASVLWYFIGLTLKIGPRCTHLSLKALKGDQTWAQIMRTDTNLNILANRLGQLYDQDMLQAEVRTELIRDVNRFAGRGGNECAAGALIAALASQVQLIDSERAYLICETRKLSDSAGWAARRSLSILD